MAATHSPNSIVATLSPLSTGEPDTRVSLLRSTKRLQAVGPERAAVRSEQAMPRSIRTSYRTATSSVSKAASKQSAPKQIKQAVEKKVRSGIRFSPSTSSLDATSKRTNNLKSGTKVPKSKSRVTPATSGTRITPRSTGADFNGREITTESTFKSPAPSTNDETTTITPINLLPRNVSLSIQCIDKPDNAFLTWQKHWEKDNS